MNTNCMFPILNYEENKSHFEWGLIHGESFKKAIKELSEIRRELMLSKNPKLANKLDELSIEQFNHSKNFAPHIAEEIKGIAEGSDLSLTDIVILNNYTDFRDIILPDEGCSTIHLQTNENIFSGQTWDMHRSAKNYMCLLNIANNNHHHSQLILTLVGCVGLMGVNTNNQLIGVNNINTSNAKVGLIWPLLVRKTCEQIGLLKMRETLLNAPVTSGHNYLISSIEGGEHLEITPTISESVGKLSKNEIGAVFHTNHCLGTKIELLEDKKSMSSTTFNRYELLKSKVVDVNSFKDFLNLLQNHDEFPKSICSHFENGAQDPSFTCGGGIGDLIKGEYIFWRGCPIHDTDYREYRFKNIQGKFILQ